MYIRKDYYCFRCNTHYIIETDYTHIKLTRCYKCGNHLNDNEKIIKNLNKYISDLIRSSICHSITVRRENKKRIKFSYDSRAKRLLGCGINHFRKYMEALFTEGMSWENHAFYGWHLDHIKPCSAFDLVQKSEQEKCFHYTNLQPLWWKDNFKKGSNYKEKI